MQIRHHTRRHNKNHHRHHNGHRVAHLSMLATATALLLIFAAGELESQTAAPESLAVQLATGRITGRIIDAGNGQALASARVRVLGTEAAALSGIDGVYTIMRAPTGPVTLEVRRIGYGPATVSGLILLADATLEMDIKLVGNDVQLSAVRVTADKERGTVLESLNQQKNASNLVNSITAEQMAGSADGDAARASQRVSGVTVQDGKYLQVRGLGERYTTASLNGARIPSPEPERKVVPLDLFTADLLQNITVGKTFTPDQPGDFAGGSVNIRTRDFPAERQFKYSMSVGGNARVMGRTLPTAPRAGGELLGMTSASRRTPNAISQTDFRSNISQSQYNLMALEQRNVWNAVPGRGGPGGSFGASVGGSTVLGRHIGYVLGANYGYSEEVRANEHFAVGNQGPDNTVTPLTQVKGTTGSSAIQWGGIANISAMVGTGSRLSLNTTATRSADNEARSDRGFDENLADSIARTTLRYVERGVVMANLQGEHQISERNKGNWSLTLGNTTRKEPDRSDIVYSGDGDGKYSLLTSLEGARRLYFDLRESNITMQYDHAVDLVAGEKQRDLRLGLYTRSTSRKADAPIFAFISRADASVRVQAPDLIFGAAQACMTCAQINVQPIGQAGSYDATDHTSAAYIMADWGLTDRTRVIAGARVERALIEVASSTQGGFTANARLRDIDILPSLNLNARITEHQNLRFAITRTLARPEYRELAPVTFRDVLGGVSVTGNNNLSRSLIDNIDLRWEVFPAQGEVLSAGVFAKRFHRPIERVESATSGAYQARFQNAMRAADVGIEIEIRKNLSTLGWWAESLTAFGNVTLMRSSVELDTLQRLTVTDRKRPLAGQAPYVVNGGLSYSSPGRSTSATLLYNVAGKRIHAAGVLPLPNIIEMPRHVLDISLRFPVRGSLSGSIDARNLLDARYRLMQGNLEREGYNTGRSYSIGLSWKQ